MARHNAGGNGFVGEYCKIRKRVCSSSSTTSSVLKKYRLQRTILIAKRLGSTTPVPMWKMDARSPSSAAALSETSQYQTSRSGLKGSQASVTARKLANALWELNKIPSPKSTEDLKERRVRKEMMRTSRASRSIKSGCRSSDPSHCVVSELSCRMRSSSPRRMLPLVYQKFHGSEPKHLTSDLLSNASLMEIGELCQHLTPKRAIKGKNSHLMELYNVLATSKELLKILIRFWRHGERHASIVSFTSALCSQLDQAHVHVDQLIQEQRSDHRESSYNKNWLAEEKDAWRSTELYRTSIAAQSIMEDLETERRLRRRAEQLNKRLGSELTQIKTSLLKATKELESERRTREIIEQVCSEMVRNIGQDKAQVEELKRESARIREELEEEREMLQLADEWREERVQMKLSEAKIQFEEKNAAVDQLRNELETFLTAKRTELINGQEEFGGGLENKDQSQLSYPSISTRATDLSADGREEGEEEGREEDDETDSEDSDLHSIELNMDSNNKGYIWSYATAAKDKAEQLLAKEKNGCMDAYSDRMVKNGFSADNGMKEEINGNFERNFQDSGGKMNIGTLVDNNNLMDKCQKLDKDAERYESVKGLRDQMLSGTKIVIPRSLPSTARRQASKHKGHQLFEGSKVAEMVKAIRESESKAALLRSRNEVHPQLLIGPME